MSIPPLDYAPAARRRRRRRTRLLLAGATLLSLALLTLILYRRYPAPFSWPARAYVRHAALTHALPPDTPALSLTPADGLHSAPPDRVWLDTTNRLLPGPNLLSRYLVTLFLHERRTPAGHPRLVVLGLCPTWIPGRYVDLHADLRLFTPGSLRSPAFTELPVRPLPALPPDDLDVPPAFPGTTFSLGRVPWGSDFRLYPAQPDPADPTAFTLRYTVNNHPGSLAFRLTDDDSVTVTTPDGRPLPHSFHPLPTTRP